VPQVIGQTFDVDRRLEVLNLERKNLVAVVRAAVAAVGNCTENDPPTARGYECWRAAVRVLREIHRSLGWEKDDASNFSTIVNKQGRIKIAVANTDDATGNPKVLPINRSRKGANSDRASQINQLALPFPEFQSEIQSGDSKGSDYATWYLCIYVDGDKIRAELSLPTRLESGYFTEWEERIMLISSDEDWKRAIEWTPSNEYSSQLNRTPMDDEGPKFEVSITRR
jgi:hypothetical protein